MSTVFAVSKPNSKTTSDTVDGVVRAWELLGPLGFIVVFFLGLLAYCIYTWTQNERKRVSAEAEAMVIRANAESEATKSKAKREEQHEIWLQTKFTELIEMGHSRMAENTSAIHEFREDLKDLRETIRAR